MVEGINIYASILDTDQLSVIRGGSFLLKDAIDQVCKSFAASMKPLSTGASSGLFVAGQGVTDGTAKDLCGEIRTVLASLDGNRSICFLVDSCKTTDVSEAKERLYAKIRYRQLQAVTQAPDVPIPTSPGSCELEGVRMLPQEPEKFTKTLQGRKRCLSKSVYNRYELGRKNAKFYYQDEITKYCGDAFSDLLADLEKYAFAGDIGRLAGTDKSLRLGDKIAVVYFDGNRFGNIQKDIIREAGKLDGQIKAQMDFDCYLKEKRARFLASVLKHMIDPARGNLLFSNATFNLDVQEKTETGKKYGIGLETLLWGGDEMLFVVPAWLGMDLVQHFYCVSENWKIDGHRLTHAGGMVFCHAKTPVRIIRRVAQQLAERVKSAPNGRKSNQFEYMVLESIDYPAESTLGAFFSIRYGEMAELRRPLSPFSNWAQQKQELAELLKPDRLPKRQIWRLADLLTRQSLVECFGGRYRKGFGWAQLNEDSACADDLSTLEACERHMLRLVQDPDERKRLHTGLEQIFRLVGADPTDQRERAWAWLHLVELWDYLVPAHKADDEARVAPGAEAGGSHA